MGKLFFKSGKTVLEKQAPALKDIIVKDIDGVDKALGEYLTDKPATIFVNTASSCGYTDNNYRGLAEVYEKYKDNGLQILAFPCNQFNSQESKCEVDIKNYVRNKFKVNFPIFSKINVNGPETHDVYVYLKQNTKEFNLGEGALKDIPWNFYKFLVDKDGKIVGHYEPGVKPSEMIPDIEKLI
jgi:glutathione peroxidase